MKNIVIAVLVVLLVTLGVHTYTAGVGGTTNLDTLELSDGLKVGSSGSTITKIIDGTCALIFSGQVIASSTRVYDCAVTGAVSGDNVIAWFGTSTVNGMGWSIVGSNASSTSGFITLRVSNLSGVTAFPPSSIASSTYYLIIR